MRIAHNGQVEVKNKSEAAGWKLIEKVAPDLILENNSWAMFMDEIRAAETSGVAKELLSVTRPVLLTVYYREYYDSSRWKGAADHRFKNLKGYDQFFTPALISVFVNRVINRAYLN